MAIDTVGLTYDALGRMVEQNFSGYRRQVVYSPTGEKLAIMVGQTLDQATVPLPGGSAALYTATGLWAYRHPDWLGSGRFDSTPSRAFSFSGAYAPYGEPYATAGALDLAFTGQTQNTVFGLYDFMFREYHPVQGRWVSPDPAGGAAASVGDPQSWNQYAYVGNAPLAATDPLGLLKHDAKPGGGCDVRDPSCTHYYLYGIEISARYAGYLLGTGVGAVCPDANCIYNDDVGLVHFSSVHEMYERSYADCQVSRWDGNIYCGKGDNIFQLTGVQVLQKGLECDLDVIKASERAWMSSQNGTARFESGFAVTQQQGGPMSIVKLPHTNEEDRITFTVPRFSIAIFHTHRNVRAAPPSPADITLADKYSIPVYTLTNRGLWKYPPGGPKPTKPLRPNQDWLKPC